MWTFDVSCSYLRSTDPFRYCRVLKLRGEVEAQERKEKVVETSAKMDSDLEGTLVWYYAIGISDLSLRVLI